MGGNVAGFGCALCGNNGSNRLIAVEVEAKAAIDKALRAAALLKQREGLVAANVNVEVAEADVREFDPKLAAIIFAPNHFAVRCALDLNSRPGTLCSFFA